MSIQITLVFACCVVLSYGQIDTQENLDKMAAGLRITYDVTTNTKEIDRYDIRLTIQNEADGIDLEFGPWEIYVTHLFLLEPDRFGTSANKVVELTGQFMELGHVQGSLYFLRPLPGFITLATKGQRCVELKGGLWSVAKSDVMGNWYMTSPNLQPRVIASTRGESLSFVTRKTSPAQWKRFNYDEYNPYTAQERYDTNHIPDSLDDTEFRIIPKPYSLTLGSENFVQWIPIDSSWTVVYQAGLQNEAEFLKEKFSIQAVNEDDYTGDMSKVITLKTGVLEASINDSAILDSPDAYTITASFAKELISITGKQTAGVFYGVVSLLSLCDENNRLLECSVVDGARFEYRGVMLDIVRNFHDKSEILQLIQLMGRYKLNKLQLHLSDDEGWRIEIPELPELTNLGSKRCHDLKEIQCMFPQLGSGPEATAPGSGFLTSSDYKDILREAVKKHVQVIPEIDMPGHARAAIKAMEVRMKRLSSLGPVLTDDDVTLTESGDTSKYMSPQFFSDNTINPCLESTYNFIEKVMDEFVNLHKDIQPLKLFHFGGNDVTEDAWANSTICQEVKDKDDLPGDSKKWLYFQKVSKLAQEKGVSLGAWADGFTTNTNKPFDLPGGSRPETYAYSWRDSWESGFTSETNNFANKGYKVVISHAAHLFFDHSYEPDPEERGLYWATRYIDTKKTFAFNAQNVYANVLTKRSGQPITKEEKCGLEPELYCPVLRRKENVIGLQACLFTKITRTKHQLQYSLFPRMLALAERAWHQAPWETLPNEDTNHVKLLQEDWYSFVRAIGHRELKRLDEASVLYRIPPPGAKLSHGLLLTASLYPNLAVEYSLDMGQTWMDTNSLVVLGLYEYRIWLRTRSPDGKRYSRIVILYPDPPKMAVNQGMIDYIANNVHIKVRVDDNYETYGEAFYSLTITLTNAGNLSVPGGNWCIYFVSVQWVESEYLMKGLRYYNHEANIYLEHVKGYLLKLGPMARFKGLDANQTLDIHLKVNWWSVSRYEQMPNWYVTAPGMKAMDIVNTKNEDLGFVAPFTKPSQYKRAPKDKIIPWTPDVRYKRNEKLNEPTKPSSPILPTPMSYKMTGGSVSLTSSPWTVLYGDGQLISVAKYLNETLSLLLTKVDLSISPLTRSKAKSIQLKIGQVQHEGNETYSLKVDAGNDVIEIVASTSAGVFNGVNSLIQLAMQPGRQGQVTGCEVNDWPRYEYRGMHVDVSRNFMPKEQILKLLDAMALYKLNKLHFHLCDDEGWRLEIPGLQELTKVGGRRCHDLTETECIMSTLGSGAGNDDDNNKYYTVMDYQEILAYATDRHIEVIPEFDMPGHSHASVKAMRARRQRLLDLGYSIHEAEEYILDDTHDPSHYFSVQMYDDNAVNPCLESTFIFIAKVVTEVKKMHKDIQPLKTFHFGGDEVAQGAWKKSPACHPFLKLGLNLKEMFTQRVSELTSDLTLAAWEDGLMDAGSPWQRNQIWNKDVMAYAWNNVWEWGAGRRAYLLANAGYKVVLSPVTHTYFDHPNEPSPDERGLYWGTRYNDVFKTFSFMPDDYYLNADVTRLGYPITLEELCKMHDGKGCPALEKTENIIGMQGQIWTETVRKPSQMDYMVFPRLLALAERAWHKASWEGKPLDQRKKEMVTDMSRFAKSLGSMHLSILEKFGIEYRVPPPGAMQERNTILANTEFPGLQVVYLDKDSKWKPLSKKIPLDYGREVTLKTMSHDRKRGSAEIKVKMAESMSPSKAPALHCSVSLIAWIYLYKTLDL